jgi:hypothetical protein
MGNSCLPSSDILYGAQLQTILWAGQSACGNESGHDYSFNHFHSNSNSTCRHEALEQDAAISYVMGFCFPILRGD